MRTPAELQRLSALLDQALDLAPADRADWLAALQGDDATLSTALRELLARHTTKETADLLDSGPAFTLPASPGTGAEFQAGDRIGPFRLIEPLGRGGMGEVWRAERDDGQLKRQVALKLPMLAARRSVLAQRFARERDILGALAHPHIARLYDAGIADDGQPWLALEVIDGQPIDAWCNAQNLDARACIELMLQVLQAVQHAHANLVIHRDLKPGNVLVTPQGQAMLLDFGIAKLLAEDEAEGEETELTRVGGRAMSLQHAAPEQISGAPISIATDVWALGALLYGLLAGRLPFMQGTRSVLEQQILHDDPPRPSVHGGALRTLSRSRAGELDTIVLKALKKLPAERYATVNALADDLQRWLDHEPVQAQPDSRWYRTSRFVARNKAAVATAAAVTAVVIAASAISIRQAQVAQQQTRIAQTEARTAQAVQEFLEGIFKANSGDQADPIKARQRTAKELLDEGAARIEKGLADAPEAKLRVVALLSDMYADMGDYQQQVALRRTAVALTDRAYPGHTPQRARALAGLASALVASAKLSEANQVLRQAQDIVDRNPAVDDELHIAIGMALVENHMRRDDVAGLPAARRLSAFLATRPPSVDQVGALLMQGRLERRAGHTAESVALLQQAMAVAAQTPGGAAGGLSTVLNELSSSQQQAGDFEGAENSLRAAIAHAERTSGAGSFGTLNCINSLAILLSDTGRAKEAVRLLAPAVQVLLGQADSTVRSQIGMRLLFSQATAHWQTGDLASAVRTFDAIAGLGIDKLDDPLDRLVVETARAAVDFDRGLTADAFATLERWGRVADAKQVAGTVRTSARLEQVRLAVLAGRTDEARVIWRQVQAGPIANPNRAAALASEAELVLAEAGPAAAAPLAAHHLAALSAGPRMSEAPYARVRLLAVSAKAALAMARASDAVGLLEEALALDAQLADPSLSLRRLSLLTLRAEAELALGQREVARTTWREAQAIRQAHGPLGGHFTNALQAAAKRLQPSADRDSTGAKP